MKKFLSMTLALSMVAMSFSGCLSSGDSVGTLEEEDTALTETETEVEAETETEVETSDDTSSSSSNKIESDEEVGFQLDMPEEGDTIAIVTTNMGEFRIRLFPDEAPLAVENFTTLAEEGYYDGVTFHRVIEDFMVQGGDPTATGSGGESIWGTYFDDEFSSSLFNITGAISMANGGNNTNTSQFFINNTTSVPSWSDYESNYELYDMTLEEYLTLMGVTVEEMINSEGIYEGDEYYEEAYTYYTETYMSYIIDSQGGTVDCSLLTDEIIALYEENGGNIYLDGYLNTSSTGHTVFGQVYEGMDVIMGISIVETDSDDKPTEDVIIESIEITTY